jgi:hypothetical protein
MTQELPISISACPTLPPDAGIRSRSYAPNARR